MAEKNWTLYGALLLFTIFTASSLRAAEAVISRGTVSLSGGLDVSGAHMEVDEKKLTDADEKTNSLGTDIHIGYFPFDNLEVGLLVSYASTAKELESGWDMDQSILTVGPYVYYHLPVTANLFLILGGGAGVSMQSNQSDCKGTYDGTAYKSSEEKEGNGFYYGVNVGAENFITDSVSLYGALTYLQMDMDGDVTYKETDLATQKEKFDESQTKTGVSIGIRVYF